MEEFLGLYASSSNQNIACSCYTIFCSFLRDKLKIVLFLRYMLSD
jgi:hypothetical protein